MNHLTLLFFGILMAPQWGITGECPERLTQNSQEDLIWVYTESVKPSQHRFSCLKKLRNRLTAITTEPNKSPDESTGDIVKALKEKQSSVRLICEGKAAADCLSALLIYPKLQNKVTAFISLEGSIRGDERARRLEPPTVWNEEARGWKSFTNSLRVLRDQIKWFLHSNRSLYALNPKERARYLSEKDDAIKELSKNTKLISIDQKGRQLGEIPYGEHQSL